jgi:hypothetical protein
MKIMIKTIIACKYGLMAFVGGIASITTNSPIALIVLIGGIVGMIAETISPTVQICVTKKKHLK